MEKLDSHIFDAVTKLRSNKNQLDESTIMALLSEKLEGLNIDKDQLTERLKRLVEYKTLREKRPYSKFLWSVFSRICTEYEEIRNISPYSV